MKKRRFTKDTEGTLRDRHGFAIGTVDSITLVLSDEADALLDRLGTLGVGGGVEVEVEGLKETPPHGPQNRDEPLEVWEHYVAVMKPRKTTLPPQERAVIRDALKVATVAECCGAIDGCAKSPFHMGQNERKRKYNGLSQILRGKRSIRTTREQIQFMLDLRDQPGSTFIPSEAAAEIAEAKRNVRQGVAFGGSDMAKRQAQEAMEVLLRHGIETHVEAAVPSGQSPLVTFVGG